VKLSFMLIATQTMKHKVARADTVAGGIKVKKL